MSNDGAADRMLAVAPAGNAPRGAYPRGQVLSVSFGEFNCSLAGFQDPTSTVKDIASFFSELARSDREFGAIPKLEASPALAAPAKEKPPVEQVTVQPAYPISSPAPADLPRPTAPRRTRYARPAGMESEINLTKVTRKIHARKQATPAPEALDEESYPPEEPGKSVKLAQPDALVEKRKKRRPLAASVAATAASAFALGLLAVGYFIWALPYSARGLWLLAPSDPLQGLVGQSMGLVYALLLATIFAVIWIRRSARPDILAGIAVVICSAGIVHLFSGVYLAQAPYCLTPLAQNSDGLVKSIQVFLSFGLASGQHTANCGIYVFSEALAAIAATLLVMIAPFIRPVKSLTA